MIKQLKKISLLISALILTSTIAGCGKASSDNESERNNEEPYEVVMEIVTLGQDYASIPKIEEEINKITIPAINCTVKLLNVGIADHAQKLSMMASSKEKVDLVVAGLTSKVTGLATSGLLLPLDELLDNEGKELKEKLGDLVNAGVINGEIYAVTADLYPAVGRAVVYDEEMAKKYGIEIPDSPKYEDLEKAFEIIKNSADGVYGTSNGDGAAMTGSGAFYNYDEMGDSNATYGVILDPANSTEIVNLYATPEYKEYAQKMKSWVDKGYMTPDSMTSGMVVQDMFKAGTLLLQYTNYTLSQEQVWSNNAGKPMKTKQTTETLLKTAGVQEVMWGIPITSEKPEKAMEFLNLMYTNSDIANLLSNGVEGLDYKKVSDNVITYADGVDPSKPGYQRLFSIFGDTYDVLQWEPATEDFKDNLKAFNEEAKVSKTLGYTFDSQSVKTEVAAVSNVLAEYKPALECGVVDVNVALPEFLNALEKAGINKIIEENQRQLDEWLAK